MSTNTIAAGHGLSGKILRGVYPGLDELQTLSLPEPQGEGFRLKDGAIAPPVARRRRGLTAVVTETE